MKTNESKRKSRALLKVNDTNMKSHQLNVYHYSNHLGKKSPLNDFVSKWVHAMSFQTDICDGL